MLYNILTVILAVYAMAVPFMMLRFIKFGMTAAEKPEEAAKETTFKVGLPKKLPKLRKNQKMTKADRKALEDAKILERNIDAYDGTGMGQEEIRHGIN